MLQKEIKKILLENKSKIKKSNILCIGDIILDHYVYGNIYRISPEAPVPILSAESEFYQLGGVGNVSRNIISLGGNVSLLYLLGKNFSSKKIDKLLNNNKKIKKIKIKVPHFKAPIKTRFINKSSQLVRVDKEEANFKLANKYKKLIAIKLKKEIPKHDLILLSDYSKGLLSKSLIKKIVSLSKQYNKKIILDPKDNDLSIYSNVDLITPNQKEVTEASNKKYLNEKNLIKFSRKVINDHKIKNILITRSEKGMLLIDSKSVNKFRANVKKVLDVTGAGDTVLAVMALMLSIGCNIIESVKVSNYVAGIVIGKNGTETVSYKEITK